jgi:predicted transcriptional regulator
MTYPNSWPRPSYANIKSVVYRITEQQKEDLYSRKVTTRDLAKVLGVREDYLSSLFPGKIEPMERGRKELLQVRKEFRAEFARKVLSGELTLKKAGVLARTPYRTMARIVQTLKKEQL